MSDTLLRQIAMLTLVPRAPCKVSVAELERHLAERGFKVHRRSIERDLVNLSAKLALVCDGAKPAGWSWSRESTPLNFGALDPHGALTLQLVQRFLDPLVPRQMMAALRPQLAQAEAVLRATAGGKLGAWTRKVAVLSEVAPLQPPALQEDILAAVSTALLEGRRLAIRYRNLDGHTGSGTISPLGLVHFDGVFYLVAVYDGYSDLRQLALHRLQRAEPLDRPADVPTGFDLETYVRQTRGFEQPSGRVLKLKLHVVEWLAQHLEERRLAKDQVLARNPDGTAVVTATVAESRRLVWWLLALGGDAEVLQPAALRREIRAESLRAARAHAPRRHA